MSRVGTVVSVQQRQYGTTLAAVASAGAGTLTVDDAAKLAWPAGSLRIGNEIRDYTVDAAPDPDVATVDLDEEDEGYDEETTIVLSSPIAGSYDQDEPVIQYEGTISTERVATVLLPESSEEMVLRVPRGLWDRLPTSVRQREGEAETVTLENHEGEWVITDVIAEDPSVDASYVNAATLPTTTTPRDAGSGTDAGFFDEAWTNPDRVVSSNDSWATAVGTGIADPPEDATTGFRFTDFPYNDDSHGTVEWLSTIRAAGATDGLYALASNQTGASHNSNYLGAISFGFNVPGGATITGITVTVVRRKVPPKTVTDDVVKLLKAGVVVGTNQAVDIHWPDDFEGIQYGGSSDLWGTSWTPADVNDPNFGCVISAVVPSLGVAEVDSIRIKVNYTIPAVTARSNTNFLLASDYGFTLPDGALPVGITVDVERHASDNAGANYAADNQVRITNGTETSADRGATVRWPTSDGVASYGGDLWGLEWTAAQINDAAFGVLVSASVENGVTASIDAVQVTVSYVMDGDA